MTDLEKFVALYKGFGIECVVKQAETGYSITLEEGDSDKLDGYAFFLLPLTLT